MRFGSDDRSPESIQFSLAHLETEGEHAGKYCVENEVVCLSPDGELRSRRDGTRRLVVAFYLRPRVRVNGGGSIASGGGICYYVDPIFVAPLEEYNTLISPLVFGCLDR